MRNVFARDTLTIGIVGDLDAEKAGKVIDLVFGSLPEKAKLAPVPTAVMQGLGERAAGRTLERAVSHALAAGVRTPDLQGSGPAATTRDFMDAVLALMPSARTDAEFA